MIFGINIFWFIGGFYLIIRVVIELLMDKRAEEKSQQSEPEPFMSDYQREKAKEYALREEQKAREEFEEEERRDKAITFGWILHDYLKR